MFINASDFHFFPTDAPWNASDNKLAPVKKNDAYINNMGIIKHHEPRCMYVVNFSKYLLLKCRWVTDKIALSLHGVRMFLRDEGYIDTGREMRGWEGVQSWRRSVGLLGAISDLKRAR